MVCGFCFSIQGTNTQGLHIYAVLGWLLQEPWDKKEPLTLISSLLSTKKEQSLFHCFKEVIASGTKVRKKINSPSQVPATWRQLGSW
jgi:hypothetical protein